MQQKKPEPPRPGLHRKSVADIIEINLPATEPPPAMRRPPPKELAAPRAQLPSIRDQTVAELAEQAREARAEAERAKAEAEALRAKDEKFDAVAYFTRFQVIALKFLLPLAAVAAAVGVTLGIYSKQTIEPKVDRAVDRQEVQAKKTVTVEDRVLVLERYVIALEKHSLCVDAERDSAIERGTGHVVDGDHANVQWAESSMPVAKARTIWKNPPWFIVKDEACPPRPAPPRLSP